MRRIIPAALAAAVIAASLTACAPGINTPTAQRAGSSGCESPYAPGDSSEAVTAKGDALSAPTVTVPTPLLAAKKSQESQLVEGDGDVVREGDQVEIGFTLLLGETGEQAQQGGYDDPFLRTAGTGDSSLDDALLCQPVGSRVALVTTAKQALGESTQVDPTSTLVLVIDILDRFPGKADGVNQLQNSALPAVVTAVDGRPGIVLPGTPAPKKEVTAVVKQGGGDKVRATSKLVYQYSAFTWGDVAQEGDSTWANGAAAIYDPQAATTKPPFAEQLVGKTVGSQIIVVQPAGSDATAGTLPNIYVIDLLGTID